MEQKVIDFNKGIKRNPTVAADGELVDALNLMARNGELVCTPVMEDTGVELRKKLVSEDPAEDEVRLLYVHKIGNEYDNYIIEVLYAEDGAGKRKKTIEANVVQHGSGVSPANFVIYSLDEAVEIKDVTSVGRTLIVSTSAGMKYCYWKDGTYTVMDSNVPYLDLGFKLNGDFVVTEGDDKANFVKAENKKSTEYKLLKWMNAYEASEALGIKIEIAVKLKANTRYRLCFKNSEGSTIGTIADIFKNNTTNKIGTANQSNQITFNTGADWVEETDRVWLCINIWGVGINRRYYLYLYEGEQNGSLYMIKDDSTNFTSIKAAAVKYINEQSVKQNRFMYPFFVRTALKMIDGNYINLSAPILMVPNSGCVPALWLAATPAVEEGGSSYLICANQSQLYCKIDDIDGFKKIFEQYGDFISGVVVAVTEPVYTYDQAKEYEEGNTIMYVERHTIGDTDDSVSYAQISNLAFLNDKARIIGGMVALEKFAPNEFFEQEDDDDPKTAYRIGIPKVEENDVLKDLTEKSVFRIIKEYTLDEFKNKFAVVEEGAWSSADWSVLDLDKEKLVGLNGLAQLEDNTTSLKKVCGDAIYAYNGRLNCGSVSETLWNGYHAEHLSGCVEMNDRAVMERVKGYVTDLQSGVKSFAFHDESTRYKEIVEVGVSTETGTVKVRKAALNMNHRPMIWFYYPDSEAKEAKIYRFVYNSAETEVTKVLKTTLLLAEHKLLNGAYWFNGFNEPEFEEVTDNSEKTALLAMLNEGSAIEGEETVESRNKMVAFESKNPFYRDYASSFAVGNGEVLAIVSNTKALSQGQFGEHQLIVFTSDGVWGVGVTDEGKYTSPTPISRDVCCNADGVCQTDDAVVFPTLQGLKMITGSEIKDISEDLKGKLEMNAGFLVGVSNGLKVLETKDWSEIMQSCKVEWDYGNRLLHVYDFATSANDGTGQAFHYVMDMDNLEWTRSSEGTPDALVAGYPYSYVQIGDKVYQHKEIKMQNSTIKEGWVLTRETAFGDPWLMKMLCDMKLERRIEDEGETQPSTAVSAGAGVSVWVSNDKKSWCRLKSLRSKSWKWYRFCVVAKMGDADGIEGIISTIEGRRADKIR